MGCGFESHRAYREQRFHVRRGPHPVRAVRRCPRQGSGPTTWRRTVCARLLDRAPDARSGRDRRRGARRRQRGRRGQPRRRPDGGAAGGPADRACPASTVNRLCGSALEAAIQASRAIETGDAEVLVAGGVESMSRAPWVMSKPERALPGRQRDAVLDDARLADGEPRDARRSGPSQPRRIGRAAAPTCYGHLAASAQDELRPPTTRSPRRPGTTAASTTTWSRCRGVDLDARRGDPRRHHAGDARAAQAGVPSPTAPSPPATRRR